jgi:hypothetical protein
MKKIIILIVSILGIGCSPKTYQTQCFSDINYEDYQSSIDSTFNYAEDMKEFFIIEKY